MPVAEKRTLKDDVKNDLVKRRVWFDDTEAADYHVINNARILCVFDRYDASLAVTDSGRSNNKGDVIKAGLQTDLYLLFIRADEYNGTPRIGQEISLDGRTFYVNGFVLYDAVYEITLKAGVVR